MNKLDEQYTDLLQDILDNGVEKKDRTGTGTISVFGRQFRHNMKDGFPLLTTKKMPFKTIVTELIWFLRGDTNIKYLVDNGCHIWDGDCYKNYLKHFDEIDPIEKMSSGTIMIGASKPYIPFTQEEFINKIKTDDEFAKKWGELGKIYGKQWRSWEGYKHGMVLGAGLSKEQPIDQIQNLINDLKTNPDSRRLMVNAWNVGELDQMVLPPCHYGFQVYTRELSVVDRIELASVKYDRFDIMDFGIPFTCTHEDIDKYYPVPRRAISLMWNQRSVDTFLGLPFNIASYGLLLEIIAKEVNMFPDELIGNLGDVHLYSNHIEQAKEQIGRDLTLEERYNLIEEDKHTQFVNWQSLGTDRVKEVLDKQNIPKRTREPFPLPKLMLNPIFLANLEHKGFDEAINGQVNFELENYQSHPSIKAPLSN